MSVKDVIVSVIMNITLYFLLKLIRQNVIISGYVLSNHNVWERESESETIRERDSSQEVKYQWVQVREKQKLAASDFPAWQVVICALMLSGTLTEKEQFCCTCAQPTGAWFLELKATAQWKFLSFRSEENDVPQPLKESCCQSCKSTE